MSVDLDADGGAAVPGRGGIRTPDARTDAGRDLVFLVRLLRDGALQDGRLAQGRLTFWNCALETERKLGYYRTLIGLSRAPRT